MHFRHPELLYGLFLLVIPVLVHLFQLRRFRKEKFTNVKFLKKAVLQTRKSSRIRKWLILALRLLILACIVLAFAQPYFPSPDEIVMKQETLVYLDNSYSMQAKGSNGILLKRSVQELLEKMPKEGKLNLFTNNTEYRNVDYPALKKELQQLEFSPVQMPLSNVMIKARDIFPEDKEVQQNLIAISDFQMREGTEVPELDNDLQLHLVQVKPENRKNISVDTAFIAERTLDETIISVGIKISQESSGSEVPVSLYNGQRLLAKRSIPIEKEGSATIDFPLPSGTIKEGRIEIEDAGLEFDNRLYFSINEPKPINVVVIGNGDASFLKRIYDNEDFNYISFLPEQIDHSRLLTADLIILNEVHRISQPLQNSLMDLVREKVYLVIIPSAQADLGNLNGLLSATGLPPFQEKIDQQRLITEIVYDHPLFNSVFEDQVENFQYPELKSYFRMNRNAEKILGLQNGEEFLVRRENIFLFTAALNQENSNFQKAPLIVPTFYNFGNLALTPTPLYYTLGSSSKIDVDVSLKKDEILELSSPGFSFIPLQQSFANKVVIDLDTEPGSPGHYAITRDSIELQTLSFNVNRNESLLQYMDLNKGNAVETPESVPAVFEALESRTENNVLWKWFVIFALLCLLTEMLILKFFK